MKNVLVYEPNHLKDNFEDTPLKWCNFATPAKVRR